MRLRALLYLATAAGCSMNGTFQDRPVVWRIDDARHIAEPREIAFYRKRFMVDTLLFNRIERGLELPDKEPAHNTNALDEVPDSTWFTNRISAPALTEQQVVRGTPNAGPPQLPIEVFAGKRGGANPGFLAHDATGRKFLVKFDTKNNPEMQTATAVIVNRFFWALGYNVPSDQIFRFRRQDLTIAKGALIANEMQQKVPLTADIADDLLAFSPRLADGRYRASSSEFLAGIPKGGFPLSGVRADDPNDTVPHQHRREVRALKVFCAWLGNTDMKQDNSLDIYVEQDGSHFIRHYLVDFGGALGARQADNFRMEDGWEYTVDWRINTLALLSLGLWRRPWESMLNTPWPSIGAFSGEHFDPDRWREAFPYRPFDEADAADLYWGAKLVMLFDRSLVEAGVSTGQLSDPDASAYLVDALMQRREKIGRAWLEGVTPLDDFQFVDGKLCATDLGLFFGLAHIGTVERLPPDYSTDHDDSKPENERRVEQFTVNANGRVCLPPSQEGGYAVDRLRIRRGRHFKPVMQVHYKVDERPRVLGVIRVER